MIWLLLLIVLVVLAGGWWGWPLAAALFGSRAIHDKTSALGKIAELMRAHDISPAEVARMREATKPVYERHKASIGQETLDRLDAALKPLR